MEKDVKAVVAENLTALRKSKNLTQSDVAKALNYSDKSVSKWEHADSLPDIAILARLCEIYGVTLDYLISQDAKTDILNAENQKKKQADMSYIITTMLMSVAVVYLIAAVVFVYSILILKLDPPFWQAFVWGVPISCVALLNYNRKWLKNALLKAVISSTMSWSSLISIYLQFLNYRLWLIFIIGIPIQVIIILGLRLNKK